MAVNIFYFILFYFFFIMGVNIPSVNNMLAHPRSIFLLGEKSKAWRLRIHLPV